jgi:hypothetical protein
VTKYELRGRGKVKEKEEEEEGIIRRIRRGRYRTKRR